MPDSALFQFTTRQLRDYFDPNHLLIKIDEEFEFGELVTPLETTELDHRSWRLTPHRKGAIEKQKLSEPFHRHFCWIVGLAGSLTCYMTVATS